MARNETHLGVESSLFEGEGKCSSPPRLFQEISERVEVKLEPSRLHAKAIRHCVACKGLLEPAQIEQGNSRHTRHVKNVTSLEKPADGFTS